MMTVHWFVFFQNVKTNKFNISCIHVIPSSWDVAVAVVVVTILPADEVIIIVVYKTGFVTHCGTQTYKGLTSRFAC